MADDREQGKKIIVPEDRARSPGGNCLAQKKRTRNWFLRGGAVGMNSREKKLPKKKSLFMEDRGGGNKEGNQ